MPRAGGISGTGTRPARLSRLLCLLLMAHLPCNSSSMGNASTARASAPTAATPLPIVPLCLLQCKDNHMLQMESEWSSDFVFPLLSLLRSGASREQMGQKAQAICRHNAEMDRCLRGCPASVENQILRIGLQPWEGICVNIRILQTQFGCWKQNIDPITVECAFQSQKLRYSIERLTRNVSVQLVETICEDMRALSECFETEYGKHCGTVSRRLVATLFEGSREAIAKMLRMKWTELPAKCQPHFRQETDPATEHSSDSGIGGTSASSTVTHFTPFWLLFAVLTFL